MRLALLSTNLAATIISVNAVITQTFEVHYTNPAAIATLPDERHILAKVAASAKPRPYATEPAEFSPERVTSTSRERERGREPRTRWPTPRGRGSRSRTASPFEGAVVDLPEGGRCSAVGDDLIEVDSMPVAELGAGSEWSYSRVMRVPNDDFVRATTLEGTDDRVRVGHVLAVEVRYRLKGEDFDKMMRIVKGITITSVSLQLLRNLVCLRCGLTVGRLSFSPLPSAAAKSTRSTSLPTPVPPQQPSSSPQRPGKLHLATTLPFR